jgi:hypothetical protein
MVRIIAEARYCTLLCNVQTSSRAHPAYSTAVTDGCLSGGGGWIVTRSGHEAVHSHSSNAEVKNCEAIRTLSHTYSGRGA